MQLSTTNTAVLWSPQRFLRVHQKTNSIMVTKENGRKVGEKVEERFSSMVSLNNMYISEKHHPSSENWNAYFTALNLPKDRQTEKQPRRSPKFQRIRCMCTIIISVIRLSKT